MTGRSRAAIGPVLVLTTLVVSVISSLGAPLIPSIARDFHEPLSEAQWSLTVGLLTGAASAPVMGRLGDGRWRKATLTGGLAVVTAGGVVAALAPGLAVLVVGRALQGVGLGLAPLTMAIARDELPRHRVGPMIAVLSVSTAAGVGAGYPISGLIADDFGLAGAFWFGTIVSAVALVAVVLVVPAAAPRRRVGLDLPGAALLVAALVALLLAVAEGSSWGWGSARVVTLLAGGAVVLAGWSVQQLRAQAPLVDLRLLRHPAVLAGDACALVLGVAMYMTLSAVTEFVQSPSADGYGFSASVIVAGFVLVPLSALMLLGSTALPALVRHLGVRLTLSLGCLLVAAGSAYFAVLHGALWDAFVMTAMLGAGLGATYAAIPGLIVRAVPAHETGSAMGFYQVVRYVGFSVGSALTASVLAAHLSAGVPTVGGFETAFWISAAVCVLAAALPWIVRGGGMPAAERLPDDEMRQLERTEGEGSVVPAP